MGRKRAIGDYLEDILKAMSDVLEFVADMDFDEFTRDTKTMYAVVRAIEIIGEATKKIPQSFKQKYPGIPWREMAGMRDKVIHEYFGVSPRRVWETVKRDIPSLKPLFEEILKDIEKRDYE